MPVLQQLIINPALPTADILALEEVRLLAINESLPPPAGVAATTAFLLFREPTHPTVVLGTGQKHTLVVDRAACEQDGVPILRRSSGGGCVLHLPGILWFSLGVPFDWLPSFATGGIRATFADVLQPICAALHAHWKLPASLRGICDIALAGQDGRFRKVAGSAQTRKQRAVLVHGTLLVNPDLHQLDRYLPMPDKQPDYRQNRSHRDFLTTLQAADCAGRPIAIPALQTVITAAWRSMLAPQIEKNAAATGSERLTVESTEPTGTQWDAARQLAREKYLTEAWTFRL